MKLIDLIGLRQSVRRYDVKQIEKDQLDLILEAARLAPSACNSQPWHFIVVDDPELKNKVARATYDGVLRFNKFAAEAPLIIVVVVEKSKTVAQIGGRLKNKEYSLYDIGIVSEHICLQAAELGIGSCMLGWFNEKKISGLLNIPGNKSIGLVLTLGYPVEGYKLRGKARKSIDEIVSYNVYKEHSVKV